MKNSTIAWTEDTWNPVSGCTEVSPGCDHCYARQIAERFAPKPGQDPKKSPYPNGFGITLRPHKLMDPLKWKEPRRIFVNSMSDLFHKDIPDRYRERIFDVMREAKIHQFQVLTKRPERARQFIQGYGGIPSNMWLGVSVEDQKRAFRIDVLRDTLAMVRFVSFEPLLGPIEADLFGLDWIIIGGESGPHARAMSLAWVRSLIAQARRDDVAIFVKQMGTRWADLNASRGAHKKDTKGENMGDWPEDLRIQEYPTLPQLGPFTIEGEQVSFTFEGGQ